MKITVRNVYNDQEYNYEGSGPELEKQLRDDFRISFETVPPGDLEALIRTIDSRQLYQVEVDQGDGLQKSVLGDAAKGLALAGMIGLGAGATLAPEPTPPTPVKVRHFENDPGPASKTLIRHPDEWNPEGLIEEMHPIAHLESSWGRNMAHEAHSKGLFNTAYGAVGLKPVTAYEQYMRDPDLQAEYPDLADKDAFLKKMRFYPEFYNAVASSHWNWLGKQHGNSPAKTAFAWRWGTGAARRASPDEIADDGYVSKYLRILNKQEIPPTGEDLEKGAMQRIAPYNPERDNDPVDRDRFDRWANTELQSVRDALEPMDGALRMRALHRLHARTQTRRNPHTGEREFLLHRGMSNKELRRWNNGAVAPYDKTSWTPDPDIAEGFARQYGDDYDEDHNLVTSWVPESAIHAIPRHTGSGKKGPHYWESEYEVLVKPFQFNRQMSPQKMHPDDIHKAEPEYPLWFQTNERSPVKYPSIINPAWDDYEQRHNDAVQKIVGDGAVLVPYDTAPTRLISPGNHVANHARLDMYKQMHQIGHPTPRILIVPQERTFDSEGFEPDLTTGTKWRTIDGAHRVHAAVATGAPTLRAFIAAYPQDADAWREWVVKHGKDNPIAPMRAPEPFSSKRVNSEGRFERYMRTPQQVPWNPQLGDWDHDARNRMSDEYRAQVMAADSAWMKGLR